MRKVRQVCVFLFLVWLEFQLKSVNGSESVTLMYESGGDGGNGRSSGNVGRLVKKEERKTVVSTEFGSISSVDVGDGTGRYEYHLEFITMAPNSIFLPVVLHDDMLFFVQTGSGKLSWIESDTDKMRRVELQQGDLYRLSSGALFYLHSSLDPENSPLRIVSIFANSYDDENQLQFEDQSIGPYSSISELIGGFDTLVLQSAFQVSGELVEEIANAPDMPAIVHADSWMMKKGSFWDEDASFLNAFLSFTTYTKESSYGSKDKNKPFNFFTEDANVKNCHGWSTVATKHDLHALKGSHLGAFMVNLTKGSMMGPHWNPKATEVSVVLQGEGMVRIVCPSKLTRKDCKHTSFRVQEGDVFVVPRFHPMAQTAFNGDSLVFMGFSSEVKKNRPQFLVGKSSVLQILDRFVLAASFGVSTAAIDELLAAKKQSTIQDCTSCAEKEEMLMEKEIEEARQKEEEEEEEEEEMKEAAARREERERAVEREREADEAARERGMDPEMEQQYGEINQNRMFGEGKTIRGNKNEARRYPKGFLQTRGAS